MKHTPETRAKISAALKASPRARAHLAELHAAKRGVKRGPRSAEWSAKIVAANRGRKRSLEIRARMSAAQMGRQVSPEARAKMRAAKLGRSLSADVRAKLSMALKTSSRARAYQASRVGCTLSADQRAKLSASHKRSLLVQAHMAELHAAQRGRKHSLERRLRSAAGNVGGKRSPESRAKMSAAKLGKPGHATSPDVRAKISAALKVSSVARAQRARISRIRPTSLEVQVCDALTAAGIEFVFQFPVSGTSYVADFYLPQKNTILEADGGYWHSRPKSVLHDAKRDAVLARLGYRVVRLGETQIRAGSSECVGVLTA